MAGRAAALVGCLVGPYALACGDESSRDEPKDERVLELRIDDPASHWHDFVEMVPGVHLPSSSAELDQVEVWLRIPSDGVVEVTRDGLLVFPAGTRADRIEWVGHGHVRTIADVRGTSIDSEGREQFFTLRPTSGDRGAPLVGTQWPRDDRVAAKRAIERLLELVAEMPPASQWSERKLQHHLDALRSKSDCAACHVHGRLPNELAGQWGLVHRGTDASGFFTPATVLLDEIPVESYGSHDRNWSDPFVTLVCPDGTPEPSKRAATTVCPADAVPMGHFDLAAALQMGDLRAVRVCRSRRYLYEHLDTHAKARFAASVALCGPM